MALARQLLGLTCGFFALQAPAAQPVISEILFNPPGTDIPHEYVELRGTPHERFDKDFYLVGVEGDTNGNPGTVQNVFDLLDLRFGGNGFLIFLQKDSFYCPDPAASILINS
jgi:hypothetical protein